MEQHPNTIVLSLQESYSRLIDLSCLEENMSFPPEELDEVLKPAASALTIIRKLNEVYEAPILELIKKVESGKHNDGIKKVDGFYRC